MSTHTGDPPFWNLPTPTWPRDVFWYTPREAMPTLAPTPPVWTTVTVSRPNAAFLRRARSKVR